MISSIVQYNNHSKNNNINKQFMYFFFYDKHILFSILNQQNVVVTARCFVQVSGVQYVGARGTRNGLLRGKPCSVAERTRSLYFSGVCNNNLCTRVFHPYSPEKETPAWW